MAAPVPPQPPPRHRPPAPDEVAPTPPKRVLRPPREAVLAEFPPHLIKVLAGTRADRASDADGGGPPPRQHQHRHSVAIAAAAAEREADSLPDGPWASAHERCKSEARAAVARRARADAERQRLLELRSREATAEAIAAISAAEADQRERLLSAWALLWQPGGGLLQQRLCSAVAEAAQSCKAPGCSLSGGSRGARAAALLLRLGATPGLPPRALRLLHDAAGGGAPRRLFVVPSDADGGAEVARVLLLLRCRSAHGSLRSACLAAADGDEIVLAPGTHRVSEPADVLADVNIRGLRAGGAAPLVQGSAAPLLRIGSRECSVRGVNFAVPPRRPPPPPPPPGAPRSSADWAAVSVRAASSCVLEGLSIDAACGACIWVGAPDAPKRRESAHALQLPQQPQPQPASHLPPAPREGGPCAAPRERCCWVEGCTLRCPTGDGVSVYGGAVAVVRDTLLRECARGVQLRAAARCEVAACTLKDCTAAGIVAQGTPPGAPPRPSPAAVVQDNTFRGCAAAVTLARAADCTVCDNRIHACPSRPAQHAADPCTGIALTSDKGSTVARNTIDRVGDAISLTGCSGTTVSANVISGSLRRAIAVTGESKVAAAAVPGLLADEPPPRTEIHISGNNISGTQLGAVAVDINSFKEDLLVVLTENVISGNIGAGIIVNGKRAQGEVRGGAFKGNARHSCAVRGRGQLTVSGCTFSGGRGSAVAVDRRGQAQVDSCTFSAMASDVVTAAGAGATAAVADCRFDGCHCRCVVFTAEAAAARAPPVGAEGSVRGCTMRRCGGQGVLAEHGARVSVEGNTFEDMRGGCIAVVDGARAWVSANAAERSGGPAITVEGASAAVEGNRCTDCGASGVLVKGQAQPEPSTVAGNTVENSLGPGLYLVQAAGVTVERNTLRRVRAEGILAEGVNCTAVVRDNEVTGSRLAGIAARGARCRPEVTGNRVTDGAQHGIAVYDAAGGTFSSNVVAGNAGSGISVASAATPTLADNTVRASAGPGLEFTMGGKGTASGNTVTGNAGGGSVCRSGGDPQVRRNTFRGNGKHGILVFERGAGTFSANEIAGHSAAEVFISLQGDPLISENTITEGVAGVCVRQTGGGRVEGNKLTGPFSDHAISLCGDGMRPVAPTVDCSGPLRQPTAVTGNTVSGSAKCGIFAGDGCWARVEKNKVRSCVAEAILCDKGSRVAELAGNAVEVCPGDGVVIRGDADVGPVTANTVRGVVGAAYRILQINSRKIPMLRNTSSECRFGVVVAQSAYCDLRQCTFEDSTDCGVQVTGCECSITFCTIAQSQSDGINLLQCSGSVEDCSVESNGRCGIQIVACEPFKLLRNVVQESGEAGICVGGSNPVLSGNEVSESGTADLQIMDNARPVVMGNTLRKSKGYGVAYRSGSGGLFRNNQLIASAAAQVYVHGNSAPDIVQNTIRNGQSIGVEWVDNKPGGRVEGNRIFMNEGEEIVITRSEPSVEGNMLFDPEELAQEGQSAPA
eukprot:TRINITY_DN18715_c0_g2_i1.p1 TRINITY_DN18715_c0_g2~~TRINITY_DN18715_c0_g2_i1.p1  ORF type:complete len:1509 (+),score=416.97 TRINITY_DN18715_c0_g2_i1:73-4527(+)